MWLIVVGMKCNTWGKSEEAGAEASHKVGGGQSTFNVADVAAWYPLTRLSESQLD